MIISKEGNRNKLLELLQNQLIGYGFNLNKGLAEFTKKKEDGWNKFQLIFLNRDDGWEINTGLLIRINFVEDIYHRASSYELKYQKTTPTIGITVENLVSYTEKHRYYLNSDEEIKDGVDYFVRIFEDIALPFFNKYNDIVTIEQAVNIKNGKSIFSGLKYEGNLGIILAKLVDNPDYFYYVEKYRKYYSELNNGYYLPEYEKLLIILTER